MEVAEATGDAELCSAWTGEDARLSTSLSSPGDGFAGFAVGSAAAFGFPFVPLLFASRQRHFDFHPAILEIHAGRNQGEALLLRFSKQLPDFLLVHQQLASAEHGVVGVAAVLIGTDVAVQEPEFAILDQAVGVFQISFARAHGLDFGSGERHPRLKFFKQEVVMASVPVHSGVLFSGRGRLAARILLPVRPGLVGAWFGHWWNESNTGSGGRWQVAGCRKS
jgi:hypothetical protein